VVNVDGLESLPVLFKLVLVNQLDKYQQYFLLKLLEALDFFDSLEDDLVSSFVEEMKTRLII
jgi:hypothetical protein